MAGYMDGGFDKNGPQMDLFCRQQPNSSQSLCLESQIDANIRLFGTFSNFKSICYVYKSKFSKKLIFFRNFLNFLFVMLRLHMYKGFFTKKVKCLLLLLLLFLDLQHMLTSLAAGNKIPTSLSK